MKAPVPIERLASQLRSMRPVLPVCVAGRAPLARDAAMVISYDALLIEAAGMLGLAVPEPMIYGRYFDPPVIGHYYDAATRALVEQCLAEAGLDVQDR